MNTATPAEATGLNKLTMAGSIEKDLAAEFPDGLETVKLNCVMQHNRRTGEALGSGDVFWRVTDFTSEVDGKDHWMVEGVYPAGAK